MQSSETKQTLSACLHWIVAAALVGPFAEYHFAQWVWPNPYFATDLFYLPTLAIAASGLIAAQVALAVALAVYRSVRPSVNLAAATGSLGIPLILVLLFYDFRDLFHPYFTQAYTHAVLGPLISIANLALLVFLALFPLVRLWTLRKERGSNGGKNAGGAAKFLVAPGLALIVALIFWRPFHDKYLALYSTMFLLVSAPALLGAAIYMMLRRFDVARLHRIATCCLWAAILITTLLFGYRESHDEGTPIMLAGFAALALWGGVSLIMLVRGARVSMLTPPAAVLGLIALPLVTPWLNRPLTETEPGKQILLLTVDTLRRDAISAYNPDARPTPNLDRLIQENLMFTRAWSPASWTLPSLASMMTGVTAREHLTIDFDKQLALSFETLPERMQERGYETEAVVFNPLLSYGRGLDQGFERYLFLPLFAPRATLSQRLAERFWPETFALIGGAAGQSRLTIHRLERNRHQPFFFWLHIFDPHEPYAPPPAYWPKNIPQDKEFPRNQSGPPPEQEIQDELLELYLAEVQYLDHIVGELMDELKRRGLYDNLTIVFTCDHGEEFWEHERWGHGGPPVESLVRMPLSIRLPDGDGPVEMDETISNQELMATLLALTDNYSLSPDERLPATDVIRAQIAEAPGQIDTHFMHAGRMRAGAHTEGILFGDEPFKYFKDFINDTETLYDLSTDPGEFHSLVEERPDLLQQARELFQQLTDAADIAREQHESQPNMELPQEILDELEDLGYLH